MPTKSGRDEIPASGSPGSLFFLSKSSNSTADGSRQFRARREAHDADLVRIDVPLLGVGAHHADGLLRIVHRVGLRVVAVAAQAIAQDDRVDAVVVKERNEIGALRADVQGVVPAARHQDHRRAGIDAAIHRCGLRSTDCEC